MTSQDSEKLRLDDDETRHLGRLSEEHARRLALANAASILTLNAIFVSEDRPFLNEPGGLVALLLAKAAQSLRAASLSLQLGYYSAGAGTLRSALEAFAFAVLFNESPDEVPEWFRNELSDPDEGGQRGKWRAQQLARAKKALLSLEDDKPAMQALLNEVWDRANKCLHTSPLGLAEEFGIEITDFIPPELGAAIDSAHGDLQQALGLWVLKARTDRRVGTAHRVPAHADGESLEIEIPFGSWYNTGVLEARSSAAFYTGNRLLEFTTDVFQTRDASFSADYRTWHREARKLTGGDVAEAT